MSELLWMSDRQMRRIGPRAGEADDNRLAGKLLSRLKPGTLLLANRGYDADWIRALAAERCAWANIPPRSHRKVPICFSPYLYRARYLVERFFNKIKYCRRVATRYDKLAANYLAFIQLASIRLWLRPNELTSQHCCRSTQLGLVTTGGDQADFSIRISV